MKNLNSFKAITRAIEHERERQIELLEEGKAVVQETRRWDDNKEYSYAMRSKEDAKDYRYFPDPDLVPVWIGEEWIEKEKKSQPEFADEKQKRYQKDFALSAYDAALLTESRHLAELFERTADLCGAPKQAANWLIGETLRFAKEREMEYDKISFSPQHLADLIQVVQAGEINNRNAKKVFEKIFDEDIEPLSYIEEQGMKSVKDTTKLTQVVEEIIKENPKAVGEYCGGKEKAFGFFIGQTMRAMQGNADPELVQEILRQKLEEKRLHDRESML